MADLFPVVSFPPKTESPVKVEAPTLFDTGKATMTELFGEPLRQAADSARGPLEFDADFNYRTFIRDEGLSGQVAQMVEKFGNTSRADAQYQVKVYNTTVLPTLRTLQNSSVGAKIVTDPITLATILVPMTAPMAVRAASRLLPPSSRNQVVANMNALTRGPLTRAEIVKTVTAETVVFETAREASIALDAISEGEDPEDALLRGAAFIAGSTAAAALLGYGIGSFVDPNVQSPRIMQATGSAAESARQRVGTFTRPLAEWINETKPARPQGGEFDFTAKWFTESSVFKLAPSGLKQVIQNTKYPDWFKRANLLLAGDSGLILKTNVEGGSVGNSVWQRSATRNGEWIDAYQVVRDSWSEMNPRGGAEAIGIEMQAGAERVRRALGQENFTLVDYEDYIGRMYMRGDEPANDFERQAIAKIGEYFKKQGVDLSDTGLLPARDAMIERTAAQETTVNRITTVSAAVAGNSRKYVDTIIKRLATQTEKKLTLIKNLEATQASRGLTPKQATLLSRLNDDIAEIGIRSDEMVRLDTDLSNVSDIDELLALTPRMELTPKQRALMGELAAELDSARLKIQSLKSVADEMDESAKNWFPIFYNRAKISQDREGFKKLVVESYLRNPTVRVWNELEMKMDTVTLPTDAASISARADKTIAGMLDEIDDDIDEAILIGAGKGKHFLNRTLDIPREDLVDYIQTNIKDVMIAYNDRIAPRVEFAKVFSEYGKNGKAPKLADVFESMRTRLADDGLSASEVDEAMMQFQSNYDLVVGTVYRNPDAISKKIADTLKTAATWTYLGRAGISAVADVATLFMDHKVSTVMRSLTALADDVSLKMVQKEIQLSGEILDIVKNMSHARELEMLSKDVFGNKFDRVNNMFFMANGLGPVTVATKLIDGLARGHTIIEASEALVKGTLNDFDKVFLARYNITPEMALRITKMPYETSNNGLRLPNTAAWTDLEAVDAFRNALRSGIANRVISATPADKPKMMNGVAYIPMSVASKLNLPEDEVVKGFYRMENALLSLPFTFYSYSLGALNKVTANYAQGAVRNRSVHFAMAMFFGYQIVKFKTPDWAWDKMGTEDKLARAFDMSGIAALYSDIGYRSLEMAQSFGAEESFIAPKFVQEPDRLGGVLSLGGAPIDWAKETADGIADFLSGNFSDGAKQIGRQMPLTGLLVLNGLGRDVTDGFAASLPNRQ